MTRWTHLLKLAFDRPSHPPDSMVSIVSAAAADDDNDDDNDNDEDNCDDDDDEAEVGIQSITS